MKLDTGGARDYISATTKRELKVQMADENSKTEEPAEADQPMAEAVEQQNSGLEGALMELRQQLNAKEEEAKNNYDRYVRQVAELDNFKKRSAREREESTRYGNEALIKELLPVLDNLERAIAHAAGGGNGKPLVEGVEMVLKGFLDALARFGVSQVVAEGQPFDPAQHEAMAQVENPNLPPNTIVEAHQKGYLLRDRLLRPALVSVSKSPTSQEKKNDDSKVENDPSDD